MCFFPLFSEIQQQKNKYSKETASPREKPWHVGSTLCWPSCVLAESQPSPTMLCIGILQSFPCISWPSARSTRVTQTKNGKIFGGSKDPRSAHTHSGVFFSEIFFFLSYLSFQLKTFFPFSKCILYTASAAGNNWIWFTFAFPFRLPFLWSDERGCVDLKPRERNPFANSRFTRAIVRVCVCVYGPSGMEMWRKIPRLWNIYISFCRSDGRGSDCCSWGAGLVYNNCVIQANGKWPHKVFICSNGITGSSWAKLLPTQFSIENEKKEINHFEIGDARGNAWEMENRISKCNMLSHFISSKRRQYGIRSDPNMFIAVIEFSGGRNDAVRMRSIFEIIETNSHSRNRGGIKRRIHCDWATLPFTAHSGFPKKRTNGLPSLLSFCEIICSDLCRWKLPPNGYSVYVMIIWSTNHTSTPNNGWILPATRVKRMLEWNYGNSVDPLSECLVLSNDCSDCPILGPKSGNQWNSCGVTWVSSLFKPKMSRNSVIPRVPWATWWSVNLIGLNRRRYEQR